MNDILQGKPEENIRFHPKIYECRKSLIPFDKADGNLNKPFWEQAVFSDEFEDILWNDAAPSRPYHRTRMKMLWDDEALYIGAYLEEDKIWGTLTERDCVIFYDNDFEVFLDPDGDTHTYYEFEMNVLNTVWDLLLTKPYRDKGMKVINGWDIKGLETAVHIDGKLNVPSSENSGWSVEIRMPWVALRECAAGLRAPVENDVWRIDFSRVEWQTEIIDGKYRKKINPDTDRPFPEDNWIWSPIGKVDMHMPELWGFLHFQNSDENLPFYQITEDEFLKWKLRKLYYREKYYHETYGVYSDDYSFLCGGNPEIEADISVTPHGYEASASTADGSVYTIWADGLIEKIK